MEELSGKELEKDFEKHVAIGNDMPPQTADNMLIAYSFYKQATEGDNTHDRPLHSDVIRTFKHDAWKRLEGMDRDEAKRKYVAHIKKMIAESKDEGRL
jgi:acyl-CoA-binding protein